MIFCRLHLRELCYNNTPKGKILENPQPYINMGVLTRLNKGAFSGCSGLTSIIVDERNQKYSSQRGILYNKSKTSVIHVPKSITGHVDIPDSVTNIGFNSFSGCSGLTSITIGNGVTSIGEGTFSDCSGLTSITIPDRVTSIGGYAFNGCSGLTSVTIPDGVTSIRERAFSGCISLTSITIPDSVTSIGSDALMVAAA